MSLPDDATRQPGQKKKKDPKMVAAGHKASEIKGPEVEREAAYKAVDTRLRKAKGQTGREHNPATFRCSDCTLVLPVSHRAGSSEPPLCQNCAD
jgi:hypothetical protein